MLPRTGHFVFIAFMSIGCAVAGWASPASSKLLALVPYGAQIVAGIEDPHNPASSGRLLLITHKCNLDFNDWVAITSVDPHREADEVIEVATSSSEGELKEHLVLVAGRSDREHIFRAAIENGASTTKYRGQGLLVVEPFVRERSEITAARWMAILDDRITIFGSPKLVRQALDRYLSGGGPDPMLVERLGRLHPDVNAWNVLVMPGQVLARHVAPGQLHASWAHILDGADELMLGIHYGSFMAWTASSHRRWIGWRPRPARSPSICLTDCNPGFGICLSSKAACVVHFWCLVSNLSGGLRPSAPNARQLPLTKHYIEWITAGGE